MADDPRFKWELATPYGISIDAQQDAWWSGHVTDVLELDEGAGGLLIATQTGGVWSLSPGGTSMPLSNAWDHPDVNCLALGPDGPRHLFAGCMGGVIYETDISEPLPLLSWIPVQEPLPTGKSRFSSDMNESVLAAAGDVNDIVVLRQHRLIVAACDGGLYWAQIPPTPQKRGCLGFVLPAPAPRTPYAWHRADEESVSQGGYFSVTTGSLRAKPQSDGNQQLAAVTVVAGGSQRGSVHRSVGIGQTLAATIRADRGKR